VGHSDLALALPYSVICCAWQILLFIDFKKACDSVRREVFYNIFVEFGVSLKPDRLVKMCLNETCSKVCIGKICLVILVSKMV
jgi:hypothetical protein